MTDLSILNEEYIQNMKQWDSLHLKNCISLQKGYKIPNIVHYTFASTILPKEICTVIELNKQMCKGCNFIFYNDNDCDAFIKKYFNEKVYSAFDSINPVYGAMKADFFRYCVLYILGGIYIDIKSLIKTPIFSLLTKADTCLLDIPRTNLEPWRSVTGATYEQWLLIFSPKHEYLSEMIHQTTEYILSKYIPQIKGYSNLNTKQKILNITGPDAFAVAINKSIQKHNNQLLHRCIDYNKYFVISFGDAYKKMYYIHKKKHYSEMNEPLYK